MTPTLAGVEPGLLERISAAGEWRTNVALGGGIRSTDPPPQARLLAVAATQAIGADFVGVDLLERDDDSHIVLEPNGAVEFKLEYALGSASVFEDIAVALELIALPARAAV